MKLRSTLKMQFSNFNDDTFLLLDAFFKMSISQEAQFQIVLLENSRLAELCTKNNIDMTPPKIAGTVTHPPDVGGTHTQQAGHSTSKQSIS